MMTPVFWEFLGFKNEKLVRKVAVSTMGNCIHCQYTKAKFLDPEYCFERYEAALK